MTLMQVYTTLLRAYITPVQACMTVTRAYITPM